jgi:hypothetical protein
MPTTRQTRRKRRRQDPQRLNKDTLYELCKGMPFIEGFASIEVMADTWDYFADEVLELWVQHYPGTRPHAWWVFDAPEHRRIVDQPPFEIPPPAVGWSERGRRRLYGLPNVPDGCLEPQETFLRRHGLLSAEEEAAMHDPNRPRPVCLEFLHHLLT